MKFNLKNLLASNQQRPRAPANFVRNASEATIYIYDMIDADWGVGAKDVIAMLAEAAGAETLNIRINSPGGDVMESRAIMAAIQRHEGKTIAHVDALAASAATSIALACDEVVMADGGLFMIHNASAFAWGDKSVMRDTADLLEKVEGSIINDYTTKTGKDSAEIAALMDAETWMTAQEALANGFIDRIAAAPKAKNTWNLSAFSKAPAMPEPESEPVPDGTTQTNANRMRLAMIA